MRVVKQNYNGPTNDALTMILSRFLKTVPAVARQSVTEPLGYTMDKTALDKAIRLDPEFQHLVDVGALWHV